MNKLLLMASIFLFYGCTDNENGDKRRVIDNTSVFKLKNSFQHEQGYLIRLFANDSSIFVSNAPDFKVFQYDFDGKINRTFGKKGPAPWEYGTIWHFALTENKEFYWVHDYPQQSLKKYAIKKDTLVDTFKAITTNNVAYIGIDNFLVPELDSTSKNFIIKMCNKSSQKKVIDLFKISSAKKNKREYLNFVFEGEFSNLYKNNILYTCFNSGEHYLIDINNYSLKIIKDFRNLPVPEGYKENSQIKLMPKQTTALSSSIDEKHIYMLSTGDFTEDVKKSNFFIDRYSTNTGKYEKSIPIERFEGEEQPFKIVKIKNNMIIGYKNGTIAQFETNF